MKKSRASGWYLVLALPAALSFSSCTLHYGEQVRSEDTVPELVFTQVTVTRYDAAKPNLELSAQSMEQYKNRSLYAQNAAFRTWNDAEEIQTEGSCALLGIDSEGELYTMFNSIRIRSLSEDMELFADNLRWNGRTEQLTSGAADQVSIKKDGMQITGRGFSASGISRTYTFQSDVSGTLVQEEGGAGE